MFYRKDTFRIKFSHSWRREVNSNVVDVHISALRKKLGYGLIQTLSGQGYRLSLDRKKPTTRK
ncbi:hypothetical protein DPB93_25635 [Salmonella enterica subsp. salamae]|nr:hypothetical protein [Salmonella enterica subsp. salamae]ECI4078903.1 hypothetical protein [Salmonella enterica subsp. salamae]EEO2384051.1 hypothetical protein [Salmonella enterica]